MLEPAKLCDSDPESQATTRQQTMILAEELSILAKTLKDRKKKGERQCVDKVEASFENRIPSESLSV